MIEKEGIDKVKADIVGRVVGGDSLTIESSKGETEDRAKNLLDAPISCTTDSATTETCPISKVIAHRHRSFLSRLPYLYPNPFPTNEPSSSFIHPSIPRIFLPFLCLLATHFASPSSITIFPSMLNSLDDDFPWFFHSSSPEFPSPSSISHLHPLSPPSPASFPDPLHLHHSRSLPSPAFPIDVPHPSFQPRFAAHSGRHDFPNADFPFPESNSVSNAFLTSRFQQQPMASSEASLASPSHQNANSFHDSPSLRTTPSPEVETAVEASSQAHTRNVNVSRSMVSEADIGPASGRISKRKRKPKTGAPMAILSTDISNFRAMVQQLTGIGGSYPPANSSLETTRSKKACAPPPLFKPLPTRPLPQIDVVNLPTLDTSMALLKPSPSYSYDSSSSSASIYPLPQPLQRSQSLPWDSIFNPRLDEQNPNSVGIDQEQQLKDNYHQVPSQIPASLSLPWDPSMGRARSYDGFPSFHTPTAADSVLLDF